MKTSRTTFILRGMSGGGKSTLAETLCSAMTNAVVCSADSYMYDDDGNYCFKPELLQDAHQMCWDLFLESLDDDEIDGIIVDNTNMQRWEWKK